MPTLFAVGLLGICFLLEAPERAIGPERRAGKWGFRLEDFSIAHATQGSALRQACPAIPAPWPADVYVLTECLLVFDTNRCKCLIHIDQPFIR